MNNHAMIAARSDVYARPDIYDMEYEGAGNLDTLFFAGLLQRRDPRHVAELACGSGRVALTLATALPMTQVVGVDSSIDMLAKAVNAPLPTSRCAIAWTWWKATCATGQVLATFSMRW